MENPILNQIKNVRPTVQSLPELVAEQIRQLIIDRHLEVGEKLPNEFELAQQLNVGRGSVREAVKLLVARNVLEIQRGKGTFIAGTPGMVDDPFGFAYMEDEARLARELMDLRWQLEPWMAEQAALLAAEEDVQQLRQWQHKVEDDIRAGADHLPDDQQFHTCIAQCTHNRVLSKLLPVITYSVQLIGSLNKRIYAQQTIELHAHIVDAIAAHDAKAARAAMEDHLRLTHTFPVPTAERDRAS